MRWLLLLALTGCTDGVAPPNLINDDMNLGDLAGDDFSVADAGEDLTPPPAGDADVDLRPQSCATACDCPSGQACIMGACSTSQQIFCCGTAACTGSSVCQEPDGRISQCSAPADGGVRPDAGGAGSCAATPCTPGLGSQLFCSLACGSLTAMCSGATKHCTP